MSAGKDGVFTLRSGPGWVRSRRTYDDFELAFEYRLADLKSRAAVAVRTWPVELGWPERGFEIPLAGAQAGTVLGRMEAVRSLSAGVLPRLEPRVWHTSTITTVGPQVTVSIDGTQTGTFEIGDFPGAILFLVSEGQADFRNVMVHNAPVHPPFRFTAPDLKEVTSGRLAIPRVLHEEKPRYSDDVADRGPQGAVQIELEVLPDGSPGAMRLTKPADQDLDLIALAAVRRWRFEPARRDGQPVGVVLTIELSFRLR